VSGEEPDCLYANVPDSMALTLFIPQSIPVRLLWRISNTCCGSVLYSWNDTHTCRYYYYYYYYYYI